MAYMRTKSFKDLGGYFGILKLEAQKIKLKPCKSIVIRFDPFSEEAVHVRNFHNLLTTRQVNSTGPATRVKVEILSDHKEATVDCKLENQNFLFKCKHLNTLELLELYNHHISSLAVEDKEKEAFTTKVKRKLK